MMHWLLLIVSGLALAGIAAALMHQPGVRLYDWIATRARRPRTAVRPSLPDTKREPLTHTG